MTRGTVTLSSVVHVSVLGTVVRILAPTAELHAEVVRVWRQCIVDGPAERRVGATTLATVTMRPPHDGSRDAQADTLRTLTQDVTGAAIRARAGQLLMFHAGGLCDQETGASIVFVAPGGTGKTTLVRTLGPGRGYISDETIAVEFDRTIAPYSKPLSIRRPDAPGSKDEIPPEDLGLSLPAVQPWLAGIVVIRRDLEPGSGMTIEQLDILDALVMLTPETSSLAAVESPLKTLAGLVEVTGGLRLVRYYDARDLEPLVEDVLRGTR